MTSAGLLWKDVFSPKIILAGLALLFLGVGGFAYYFAQEPPTPVEQIPFTPLPEKIVEIEPDEVENTGDSERPQYLPTRKIIYKTVEVTEPKEIIPPTVNILSPATRTRLAAPASIRIEAEVSPKNRKIEKVEFFYARVTGQSFTIYNTIKDVQIANAPLIRVGEVRQSPLILDNVQLKTGVYSIYAIVKDEYGIRQISSPQTIVVDEYLPTENPLTKYPSINYAKDIGWRPAIIYSPSISEPPKCMELEVKSTFENVVSGTSNFTSEGQEVRFRVEIKDADQSRKYKYEWRITAGEILNGQGSDTIVVNTDGLGGQTVIATVRVEDDAGCVETKSGEAYVLQQGEPVYRFAETETERLDYFVSELSQTPSSQGYVIAYGGMPFCRGEAEALARFSKNYLIGKAIDKDRIKTIDGGFAETSFTKLYPVPKGESSPEPDQNIVVDVTKVKACSVERLRSADQSSQSFPPPRAPYKGCRDIGEKLNFLTTFDGGYESVNVCPFNSEDPRDERNKLQMELSAKSIGIFGDTLTYKYLANGGIINPSDKTAIWDWNLDSVKFIPGTYTAVLETDDDCGSKNVTAQTVHITNYCMPCFTGASFGSNSADVKGDVSFSTDLITGNNDPAAKKKLNYSWRVSQGTVVSGQGTKAINVDTRWIVNTLNKSSIETSVEISGLKGHTGMLSFNANLPFNKNALSYDWTVSDSKGVVMSEQKTKYIGIDLSKLNKNDKIILSVKVSGFNILYFDAWAHDWVIEKTLTKSDLKYDWSIDKGTIISGQGSNHIEVDTGDLLYGTEINAIVKIDGLREYCVNEVREVGVVGYLWGMWRPNANPPPESTVRRGRRKNKDGVITQSEIEETTRLNGQSPENGTSPPDATPKSDEKEYIKIEWPKDNVQIQEAFEITVTYNRVKESLDVTDTQGQFVAELKAKDMIQLVKDKWGDDYVVWAQMRLQSSGLYQSDTVTCSPKCETDFLPLSATEQKWTFNVTARNPGEQKFNLEMWIKGKHKVTNYENSAERVWGKEGLKVVVNADLPTNRQLFFSSGFLCMLGFVFAVRGIKFKGIKILIAGGNIAGRDMAGGDIVGGDKIGGDKATDGDD
ncbi:MAG: hypothetical protein WBD27_03615 [Pyrinomonadaceae bacterium]